MSEKEDVGVEGAGTASGADSGLALELRIQQLELERQRRELHQIQTELELSRDRYARLFDEAPVGYVVFDRAGVIRAVNLTAAKMLGRPDSELEGGSFLPFLVAAQHDAFLNHLRRVFDQSGLPSAADDLVLDFNSHATERVMRLRSSRRESLVGVECFTVLVDITERRLAEEQMRRARDALAQVARLNAVGILASSLIHELLQPLSAAGFFCSAAGQLAQGPAADPERLIGVIDRIDGQVRRASDIMERLRTFLRGRQMCKVAVPLEQVLTRACDLVCWFASDHKVQLRCAADTDLPEIFADPVQIEQVLVNLLCNAVQAIEDAGSARREIAIEAMLRASEVELIVRDTGPGLGPGRHESVFDIFASTNDSSLGLGLAISRAIAEAHDGRLWAEPEPEEGAVFHFTLPLMRTAAATPPAASAPSV